MQRARRNGRASQSRSQQILYYLVAFAIIISFHIFIISVYWQVDVPKTQILLGSKGSSGFVLSPSLIAFFMTRCVNVSFSHAQY